MFIGALLIGFAGLAHATEATSPLTAELRSAVLTPQVIEEAAPAIPGVHTVPFYSQFTDITPAEWKKIACGVASLAMLVDFYGPAVTADTLLQEGIASGAYIYDAGWSHAGLINLARKHGLDGRTQTMGHLSMPEAFAVLEEELKEGPVMVSVHYTFDPRNPIPHLVVVNGVHDGRVYYNDPAEKGPAGSVSVEQFQSAWKKRFIAIRPAA